MSLIVCNASPLIALHQIGELALLNELFETIIVPPAVQSEVQPSLLLPPWIEVKTLAQPIGVRILGASLGRGESETIALSLEIGAAQVLLDDRAARRLALSLNLPVAGVAALLLKARQLDLIPAVKPRLDRLLACKFRLSPAIYTEILAKAGE